MMEDNYYNYKNYSLSVKPNGSNVKVRLWENLNGDNKTLSLKTSKNYDYKNNYIMRTGKDTFSQIPIINKANTGKNRAFMVFDDEFKVIGTMKDGKISNVTDVQKFPENERQFNKLGNLARRVCKKLVEFAQGNETGIVKGAENIRQSKVFELLKKV